MAIDMRREVLLPFRQALQALPPRSGGKRPHVSTLHRWAQRGLRGVRLETIRVGGLLCTSMEAIQRFFDALSGRHSTLGARQTSEARRGDAARVEDELRNLGL